MLNKIVISFLILFFPYCKIERKSIKNLICINIDVSKKCCLSIDSTFKKVDYPHNMRAWGVLMYQQYKNADNTLDLTFYTTSSRFEDSIYYTISKREINEIFNCDSVSQNISFSNDNIKGYFVESLCSEMDKYCKIFVGYSKKNNITIKFIVSGIRNEYLLDNLISTVNIN